jgi:transposase
MSQVLFAVPGLHHRTMRWGDSMSRRKQEPLRALHSEERALLEQVQRARSERADRVARATALLAVADGDSYTAAAQRAGRRSGDGVAQLVARFNALGIAALDSRHGGGPARQYGSVEQERILAEFQRTPDREQDGTASWSLTTLQRAVRRAPDGLPQVSTFTILQTLHEAGYTYQRTRTWCQTGTARRKRKRGTVTVTDPDATPKKS